MASVSNSCPFLSEMCEETLEQKSGEGRCVSKNEARRVHRYEKIIAARRAKRKEKKRNRKARLAQSKLFNGSRENAHSDVRLSKRLEKEAIQKRLLEARGTTPRVCIDLGLTDLMSDKELNKLSSQLRRLYGSNRHSSKPLHLYFTNFAPSCRLYRMCVMKNEGFRNYMVEMTSENHAELFSRDSIVYLSPDAPESLPGTPLDASKVYVIGGLVDETVHKLVSLERAQSEGVRSARLPIDEFLTQRASGGTRCKILTVNQVFDALLKVHESGGDWSSALAEVLPNRTGFIKREPAVGTVSTSNIMTTTSMTATFTAATATTAIATATIPLLTSCASPLVYWGARS